MDPLALLRLIEKEDKEIKQEIQDDEYENMIPMREIKEEVDEDNLTTFGEAEKFLRQYPDQEVDVAFRFVSMSFEQQEKWKKEYEISSKQIPWYEMKKKDVEPKKESRKKKNNNWSKKKKTVKCANEKRKGSHPEEKSTAEPENAPKAKGKIEKLPKNKIEKKIYTCPECNKRANNGTCLCNNCNEWVHLKCARIRSYQYTADFRCSKCSK